MREREAGVRTWCTAAVGPTVFSAKLESLLLSAKPCCERELERGFAFALGPKRNLTLLYRRFEPKAGSRCIIEVAYCAQREELVWEESLVEHAFLQLPGRSVIEVTEGMTRSSTNMLQPPPTAGAEAPKKLSICCRSRVGAIATAAMEHGSRTAETCGIHSCR